MELDLEPGLYVVAVSGGVDSVVLLNMLSKQSDLKLIVAHYDHGIRVDSQDDRHFVEGLSKSYHLPFVYDQGHLGPEASEAEARKHRYIFLHQVRQSAGAKAIITAHHQDDLIETVMINILRGTGRKGLSPLWSTPFLKRPLLGMSKKTLLLYARSRKLSWHEDSTNEDTKYLRNYLRHNIVSRMTAKQRKELLSIATVALDRNRKIDELLIEIGINADEDVIRRQVFICLPHAVARECLSQWLRVRRIPFDSKTIERLTVQLKVLSAGSFAPISQGEMFHINRHDIRLNRLQSV